MRLKQRDLTDTDLYISPRCFQLCQHFPWCGTRRGRIIPLSPGDNQCVGTPNAQEYVKQLDRAHPIILDCKYGRFGCHYVESVDLTTYCQPEESEWKKVRTRISCDSRGV